MVQKHAVSPYKPKMRALETKYRYWQNINNNGEVLVNTLLLFHLE